MTTFRLDTNRPRIDGDAIVCPGCGQTLNAIVGDAKRIPMAHYPNQWPVSVRGAPLKVGTQPSGAGEPLCPYRSDDLLRLVFIAQIDHGDLVSNLLR